MLAGADLQGLGMAAQEPASQTTGGWGNSLARAVGRGSQLTSAGGSFCLDCREGISVVELYRKDLQAESCNIVIYVRQSGFCSPSRFAGVCGPHVSVSVAFECTAVPLW